MDHVSSQPHGEAATPQRLVTADGELLAARHIPHVGGERDVGVVLAHGFTGSTRRLSVRAIMLGLASHAGVLAFDSRGHGASTGRSTLGIREALDVDAAVLRARALGYRRIVTCGWSMGATAVLRHAALYRGVDAVVSVSAVSRWFSRQTAASRRLHWLVEHRLGRLITRQLLRTRVADDGWDPLPDAPIDLVGRIAPIPLLLVHGDRDAYFTVEHPEALAGAAGDPSELWIVPGFGHAEEGATPELVERIGQHLPVLLSRTASHEDGAD
jgi:pimeloyl-ACP methyl ester carboxylesterase